MTGPLGNLPGGDLPADGATCAPSAGSSRTRRLLSVAFWFGVFLFDVALIGAVLVAGFGWSW